MSMTPQQNQLMCRSDYKAIKHMNKEQLTQYMARIYQRGYEAGLKAAKPAVSSSFRDNDD